MQHTAVHSPHRNTVSFLWQNLLFLKYDFHVEVKMKLPTLSTGILWHSQLMGTQETLIDLSWNWNEMLHLSQGLGFILL